MLNAFVILSFIVALISFIYLIAIAVIYVEGKGLSFAIKESHQLVRNMFLENFIEKIKNKIQGECYENNKF